MTERQKKIAIIAAVVMIALFLFLKLKGDGATIINRAGGNVSNQFGDIGGITIPARGAISIPGLTIGNALGPLSAISACCTDCGSTGPRTDYAPAVPRNTYVYNAGDRGPTIYNYIAPVSQQRNRAFGSNAEWNAQTDAANGFAVLR